MIRFTPILKFSLQRSARINLRSANPLFYQSIKPVPVFRSLHVSSLSQNIKLSISNLTKISKPRLLQSTKLQYQQAVKPTKHDMKWYFKNASGAAVMGMTAEDKLRPWLKFDDKEFWVMVGKLKIRMATLGERDPIGYKRQKMGLPHQNSESAREYRAQKQMQNQMNGGFRGHSPNYRGRGMGHSPNYRGGMNQGHSPNYRGRGGYQQNRGGYGGQRGGYDNSGYRGRGRGGYDNNRGGFRGRGRGGYAPRGGYNNMNGGMNGDAGGKFNSNNQFNAERTTPY